jgi:anti-sigma regulatory factor (Ser/Thr protein kinase)
MRPERWPLQDTLPLGSLLTAASCARAHVRVVLLEWGMSAMADTVELILTELVTNAVEASRAIDDGPFPVRFWMLSDRSQVLIVVWDASQSPPVRSDPDNDTENGRGLMLVDALSAQWDWYPHRIGGKCVWAIVTSP